VIDSAPQQPFLIESSALHEGNSMSLFTQENKKGYKWLGQKQASKQNLQ